MLSYFFHAHNTVYKTAPSKEMISQLKFLRNRLAECEMDGDVFMAMQTRGSIAKLEEEIGDWNGETIDYTDPNERNLILPNEIFEASRAVENQKEMKKILDWLGPPPVEKRRINATSTDYAGVTLVFWGVMSKDLNFLSIILQFGGNVDHVADHGGTPLIQFGFEPEFEAQARLLLEWGADYKREYPLIQSGTFLDVGRKSNPKFASDVIGTEFGGRRCEVIGFENKANLNGKTCVVQKYIPGKERYKIIFEESGEAALVTPQNLKRRDRTPNDCGYYITWKKGRYKRHNFATKEECQAFVSSLSTTQAAEQLAGLNIRTSNKKGKKKRGRK